MERIVDVDSFVARIVGVDNFVARPVDSFVAVRVERTYPVGDSTALVVVQTAGFG